MNDQFFFHGNNRKLIESRGEFEFTERTKIITERTPPLNTSNISAENWVSFILILQLLLTQFYNWIIP